MVKIIGVLAVAVVIAVVEVPYLLRVKQKRELWVFLGILVMGTALGIATSLEVEVPSPLKAIELIYRPLADIIFGMLEK